MTWNWEAQGEDNRWSDGLYRLREYVGPGSKGRLTGVGMFFTGLGTRPMAVIDDGRPDDEDRTDLDAPLESAVVPLSRLTGAEREFLEEMNPPDELVVMRTGPPQPLSGTRLTVPQKIEVISSPETRELGTLGPKVDTSFGAVFMTAGHVTGEPGTDMNLVARGHFGHRRHLLLGEVVFRQDPADERVPTYDIGLIEPHDLHVNTLPHDVASLGPACPAPYPVTVMGGRSGPQHAMIQGALWDLSDAEGTRTWRNSWMVMPGHCLAEGDSGAVVFDQNEAVVGMLVAGSRKKGARSFDVMYAHDLASAIEDLP